MATHIEGPPDLRGSDLKGGDWITSAISYLRVSTDKQGIDGYGIEAQRQAIAALLNGNMPLMEFVEEKSGKETTNRPQLNAAWKACKAKKATLVVARLDRLSRSVHDISGWLAQSYDFRCADMPERNPFMIHVYAAFAEEERRKISERTKLAMQAARDQRGRSFGAAANPAHGARLAAQNRAKAIEAA
jgi:DNA invertase Pin-like site-specific DNA recombinase